MAHQQELGTVNILNEESTSQSFNVSRRAPVHVSPAFTQIGWGTCGVVYEQADDAFNCVKKEKAHYYVDRDLENDFKMHQILYHTFRKHDTDVHIPCPNRLIPANDQTFVEYQQFFPIADQNPSSLLLSERIPTLPQPFCQTLIDRFCPEGLKDKARTDSTNRSCLARVYLGRLRHPTAKTSMFFSLNNFPLCLDQFPLLGLEVEPLRTAMAQALAIMHWDAKVDARDVEFVLGSPPQVKEMHRYTQTYNTESREIYFWMLDFNQVQSITMDGAGLQKAVEAFKMNDPYYPRPGRGLDSLWKRFKEDYLVQSKEILGKGQWGLATRFLEMVEVMQKTVDEEACAARIRVRNKDY
jgi:hypothetical protein